MIDTSNSFAYAGPTALTVRRISDEPIVAAGTVPGYGPIFNAGLIHHEGFFHLFARGVRDSYRRNDGPGPLFLDYISDVLVFTFHPLYPAYPSLMQQQLAGVVMMVEQLVTLGTCVALLLRPRWSRKRAARLAAAT